MRKRPVGLPKDGDLVYEDFELDTNLKDGEVLIKMLYCSLDPAQRGWMTPVKSYTAPVPLNGQMKAFGIGEVVDSKDPDNQVGKLVEGYLLLAQYAKVKGKILAPVWIDDTGKYPMSSTLSVLGTTGITAYFGLFRHGRPKPGDEVLVTGAAGATGSMVCQYAKNLGCRVVGVAGGQEKCDWLRNECGVDEVVDYKATKDLQADIHKALPRGFDVFYDNVGGEALAIAMRKLKKGARIVICGQLSTMNKESEELPSLPNYMTLLVNKASVEGFTIFDYKEEFDEARNYIMDLLDQDKLKYRDEIVPGLEGAFKAFQTLFTGGNKGKLMVEVKH